MYPQTNNYSQAEFNMSFNFLFRLNAEFYGLAEAKGSKNLENWINYLAIIFAELYNYTRQTEQKEYRKKIEALTNEVHELISGKCKGVPQKLYWELIDFELELRKIMKKNNMELKMSEDLGDVLR